MRLNLPGMRRILCTADLHTQTGPKGELETSADLLKGLGHTAIKHRCDTILINGDLWDEKHGIRTEVHLTCYEQLQWLACSGLKVILIRGNHEVDLDKANPEYSLIQIYHRPEIGIHVINKPTVVPIDEGKIWMLPWYPPDAWLKFAKSFAKEAAKESRIKILFSHIGIKEGTVSASNIYTVNQRTSLNHLEAHNYDWVILGDYHKKQDLAENVFYTGMPIPRMHGDAPSQGAVVLDLSDVSITDVELEGVYPSYRTIKVESHIQTPFILYPSTDYVRIKAPQELVPVIRSLYPHPRWEVEGYSTVGEKFTSSTSDRLEKVERNDLAQVVGVWLKSKGLTENRYREVGMKYLLQSVDILQ